MQRQSDSAPSPCHENPCAKGSQVCVGVLREGGLLLARMLNLCQELLNTLVQK